MAETVQILDLCLRLKIDEFTLSMTLPQQRADSNSEDFQGEELLTTDHTQCKWCCLYIVQAKAEKVTRSKSQKCQMAEPEIELRSVIVSFIL